ncbi:MAG: creatininase family protein [Candidatus Hodarchaeales archaeon]|jgi:creatinine amidohydrolase
MVEMAKITRGVFKKIIEENPLIIIPVGSIEQHGPHSPLGTDSLIAEHLAQEATKRTGTLCAPTIFIGLSEHHKEFPGSLWISYTTYFNYLMDVARSLVFQGAKKLIFVNGHGGNSAQLSNICSEIRAQLNVLTLVYQWWEPDTEILRIFGSDGYHADGVETSMISAVDQELVDMEELKQIIPEEVSPEWSRKIDNSMIPLFTHEFSPSGIAGTLETFSVEKGKEIKEVSIKRLVNIIHEFSAFNIPE